MILTLQKLLQKSRQVSDPRDAHALAVACSVTSLKVPPRGI
jgi:hypothetical protein